MLIRTPQINRCKFPYEEIRDVAGELFVTAEAAMMFTGHDEPHIWFVIEREESRTHGPASFPANNITGYVATTETHDNDNVIYKEEL